MQRYLLTVLAIFMMGFGIYSIIKGFEEGTISNFFTKGVNDSVSVDESPKTFWSMMAFTAFCTCVSPYFVYILWTRNQPKLTEKNSK